VTYTELKDANLLDVRSGRVAPAETIAIMDLSNTMKEWSKTVSPVLTLDALAIFRIPAKAVVG